MIPNRQSPAYALFTRRPNVPHPPDVLAADPPANQEPIPPSGTENRSARPAGAASAPIVKLPHQKLKTTQHIAHLSLLGGREKQKSEHLRETNDLAVAWPPETRLRVKIRGNICNARGGVWPTNFERLRETKDLSASLRIGNSAHRRFQDIQENFGKHQAKFGSRHRPRNYYANHAIFLRVHDSP